MSHPELYYPPSRYGGESGLVNATLRPNDRDAEVVYSSGTRVRYLATHASTDGKFGLFRWEMSAARGGPGPHFHRTISESFYILSGTIRVYDGRDWQDAGPGDYLYVPEGGIHGFRNESGQPASMLILFAPGATREDYFETLASGVEMTDEERAAFYVRHDNTWV